MDTQTDSSVTAQVTADVTDAFSNTQTDKEQRCADLKFLVRVSPWILTTNPCPFASTTGLKYWIRCQVRVHTEYTPSF